MKRESYLIKPASSLCNMNCKYCFYSDVSCNRENYSKGIMSYDLVSVLVEKAMSDAKEITFAFQGGEPTLAGIDYFQYFINCVNKHRNHHIIHYALQTNGINLNKEWLDLFEENNFLVGISIDGNKKVHDHVRLKRKEGTFDKIINNIHQIQKRNIDYNILTVVTSQMVPFAKEVYEFYKKQNFQYIQFIPCLPELDDTTEYCLSPQGFYQFYHQIFSLWYEDLKKGHYISISLFEDLLMIFSNHYPRTCGMLGNCQLQLIIEGDGSIYPCDFYALDEYCLGNIKYDSIDDIKNSIQGKNFIKQRKRYSKVCQQCMFKNICHGQCKRMNIVYFDDEYCGYQEFLKETYKIFYEIGKAR